ncbi:MAG TPA: M48 family metallopeptidase [Dyella sp.]|uniref:M48 family metallopeptidase n=1 Tax=Dyella sp. TaxID=1869338 RepID=UPI002F9469B3
MDFFAQQARVRGSSRRMVVLFALAVLATVAAVDALVWLCMGERGLMHAGWSNYRLIGVTSMAVLLLIGGCALYRIATLSGGGKTVAEGMGAVPVPPDTQTLQLRLLRNVIEEVAIASGLPVPDIYLLPEEPGINAFAAGYSASDAAICVTQGCLDHLSRDELQGVIAHEFSHILNGDMRLNIRLIGLLFGIMALAVIGRQLINIGNLRIGRRGSNDGRAWMLGLALLAIGYIGYFFGRLIQSAVARSRESLADASAVQFTRQTRGIAGALKKIAALGDGSRLQAANRHEVAHMLFGDADAPSWLGGLYATHPPLLERIRELDPVFREKDLEKIFQAMQGVDAAREAAAEVKTRPELDPLPFVFSAAAAASAPASMPISPSAALVQATHQPETALALLFALLMSPVPAAAQAQQRRIADALGDDVRYAAIALVDDARRLAPGQPMTLLSLAFPALKQLPAGRLQTVLDTLQGVTQAGGELDLDRYCLARLLLMQLSEAVHPRSAPIDGKKKLPACTASVALTLAVVALHGGANEQAAKHAWLLGMAEAFPGSSLLWRPLSAAWQSELDRALDDLDGLLPPAKEIFIQSLLKTIRADGELIDAEMALLRVICASLHCAVPVQ